tara:strand:- start:704 stop:886 length:183 start_codon:yes stop_codon:yes gene_type:complete
MGFYNWLFGSKKKVDDKKDNKKEDKNDKQLEVEKQRYNLRSNDKIQKGKIDDFLDKDKEA